MKYFKKLSRFGIALVIALAVSVIVGSEALAAVPSSSGTTKIELMTSQINQGSNQGISISVKLTDAGKPLGNKPVEFNMATDFFGNTQVDLGTVQTDATGTATLVYQPTWDGTYNFTANFSGDSSHPQVQVSRTMTYSGPVPQYAPEASGLQPVRTWITPVIYGGVGLLWLFLIFMGYRTFRGIQHAGKEV